MKKIAVIVIILAVAAYFYFRHSSEPDHFKAASAAELQGKHELAYQNYIKVIMQAAQTMACPDKNKAVTRAIDEWIRELDAYLSWATFSHPTEKNDYRLSVEGIRRCLPFIEKVNFITDRGVTPLPQDSLEKEWYEAFVRLNRDETREHVHLVSKVMPARLSILRINAMTGYIYHIKLLDIATARMTTVVLYPNTEASLLIRPGEYLLFCSSEVQFTEGLKGKTWYSPLNVIPLQAPDSTSLYSVIMRTSVRRPK